MDEEQAKEMVGQYQHYQQQMQSIMIQRDTMQLQLFEVNKALEELAKTKNEKAYKITGQIMVIKPVEEIKVELTQQKEALEIKIKSMENNEQKVTQKLKELEAQLKKMVE
ncbi:MAG: prefoldin subunit [Candidatus Aenigmarchaeota archaeon]|nr:prefoldin subunit [Candidatus Aenigmarchaeota archaeon]